MNQHKKRGSESCDSKPLWRLLHEGDLLRCFRNSVSVTYVSTLPSTLSSAPCISYFVQSLCTYEANVREWHFGDCCIIPHLRRHFRDSGLVMCVSTLPSPSLSVPCIWGILQSPCRKSGAFSAKDHFAKVFSCNILLCIVGELPMRGRRGLGCRRQGRGGWR